MRSRRTARALAGAFLCAHGACGTCALMGTEACGSFAEDAPANGTAEAGGDGSSGGEGSTIGPEGGGGPDAADATDERSVTVGRKCVVGTPFGMPHPLSGFNGFAVEAARVSADGLSGWVAMYPGAAAKSGTDLFTATKSGNTFSGFVALAGVNAPNEYDSYPSITPDGQYLVFSSDRLAPNVTIFTASKGTSATFGGAQPVLLPPTMTSANEPYLLGNGTTLYFSASPTAGKYALYRADGPAPLFGVMGATTILGAGTLSDDVAPVASEDQLELFWASTRGGAGSVGDLDVWTATRFPGSEYQFAGEKIVPALSSTGKDYPTWLSPDACHLYIVQKSGFGIGSLMVADR